MNNENTFCRAPKAVEVSERKKNSQIVLPAREQIYEKLKLYEKGRPSAYLTKPIVLSLISSSAVIFRPFGN